MAKKTQKTPIVEVGSLQWAGQEHERLRVFHIRFAMLVSATAFEDLDISVYGDDESHDPYYGELEGMEAISRLNSIIGMIPQEFDDPSHWRDIANSEFHLSVGESIPVDDTLAWRIGNVIKRRNSKRKRANRTLNPRPIARNAVRDKEIIRLAKQGIDRKGIQQSLKTNLNVIVSTVAIGKVIERKRDKT